MATTNIKFGDQRLNVIRAIKSLNGSDFNFPVGLNGWKNYIDTLKNEEGVDEDYPGVSELSFPYSIAEAVRVLTDSPVLAEAFDALGEVEPDQEPEPEPEPEIEDPEEGEPE